MKTLSDEQMNRLIDFLQGTCRTLEDALQALFGLSEDDLTIVDHHTIDTEIFVCDICEWWFEMCEMAEDHKLIYDFVCENCAS